MSPGLSLALIAASVLAVAVVWIAVTRRSKVAPELLPESEPIVVWLRPMDEPVQHAVRTAELRFKVPTVQALAFCGDWPANELVSDGAAPKCPACERRVDALEDREE